MSYKVNTVGVENLNVTAYDAECVPDDIWRQIQSAHRESIRARLPQAEWERADQLVLWNDFYKYKATRENPQLMVGRGWLEHQLHRDPQVVTITDNSKQVVGAALSSNNTSASVLRGRLSPIEYWGKMLISPGVHLPTRFGEKLSGRRYVHLREAYSRPDMHQKTDSEDSVIEVSGIVLMAIYHALNQRHLDQQVATYIVPEDPADGEMLSITSLLSMRETDRRLTNLDVPGSLPNKDLVRLQDGVSIILKQLVREIPFPGTTKLARHTKQSVKAAKKAAWKRSQSAYYQELDARYMDPGGK